VVKPLTRADLADAENLNQAMLRFERVLGYANHLELYSERTGPQGEARVQFLRGLYTPRVDQRRIQSGPYAEQLEWHYASLAMKHC